MEKVLASRRTKLGPSRLGGTAMPPSKPSWKGKSFLGCIADQVPRPSLITFSIDDVSCGKCQNPHAKAEELIDGWDGLIDRSQPSSEPSEHSHNCLDQYQCGDSTTPCSSSAYQSCPTGFYVYSYTSAASIINRYPSRRNHRGRREHETSAFVTSNTPTVVQLP